jgi:hypothetical protein
MASSQSSPVASHHHLTDRWSRSIKIAFMNPGCAEEYVAQTCLGHDLSHCPLRLLPWPWRTYAQLDLHASRRSEDRINVRPPNGAGIRRLVLGTLHPFLDWHAAVLSRARGLSPVRNAATAPPHPIPRLASGPYPRSLARRHRRRSSPWPPSPRKHYESSARKWGRLCTANSPHPPSWSWRCRGGLTTPVLVYLPVSLTGPWARSIQ